jgi:hypothetical protein
METNGDREPLRPNIRLFAKVFLIVIALLFVAALIIRMVGLNPSEIWDWYDLDDIRNNLDSNYILMNHLDSSTAGYEELASETANEGKGWQPIGTAPPTQFDPNEPYNQPNLFTGTFKGQGYEIRDLVINRPDETYVGLFGFLSEGGVIENVGVANEIVIGEWCVGGLVGANAGHISNSYLAASNVGGNLSVGSLVGINGGDVSNSYFTAGNVTGNSLIGGLMGSNYLGTVRNSHYDYDEVLINQESVITIGALFGEDFKQWLTNGKFLDVNQRLSQDNGYYLINNVRDFRQLVAFGQDSSLKFRLKGDLDLAHEPNFFVPYLDGEFHGNGYKISHLTFNFDFVSQVGLFGYLAAGAKVSGACVENVNVTSCIYLGGVVGYNKGTINNSYATGIVNGQQFIGGVVGSNEGTVSNCYATGNVSGDWPIGGVVGLNQGTVSNCYATSNVSGNWFPVGGLVGSNSGTVTDSYAAGSVSGESCVGGLVGYNSGTVRKSYSAGSVVGKSPVGGLVGCSHEGNISNSFWDKDICSTVTGVGEGVPTEITGKPTTEMRDITTFSGVGWNIIAVASPGMRNPSYIWNIVNGLTYPFLNWQW